MNKINVKIDIDNIVFSISKSNENEKNLNYTNVINPKKIKFSEDYILNNLNATAIFFKEVLKREKINKVLIKNMEIAETVLKLIKYIPSLKKVYFLENKKLSYTISNLLLENRNISYINCYTMPEYVFNKFDKKMIDLRYDYFFVSHFMDVNKLDTYSKIFYKKTIIIDRKLDEYDKEDMIEFFKINKNLKKVEILEYEENDINTILDIIKEYGNKQISILIKQTEKNTDLLFKNVKKFEQLEKKYNVKINIKYSNEYKNENFVKQINISLIRFIILLIIIICIISILIFNFVKKKDSDKIENIHSNIEQIIEEEKEEIINEPNDDNNVETKEEQKISAYFTNYTRVLSELVKINKDTVGWITVKNTNVNYPVVQSKDNEYYLNHDFNLEINLAGWIYVDYRNNIKDLNQNTIIYGHNVKNTNFLFSTLTKTLEESWYKNKDNRIITFNTLYENNSYEIFSIYTIPETNEYLITDFSSPTSFIKYIQKAKDRSIYNFGIEVKETDKIITLSTCYGGTSDYRIVIHAKKI